MECVELPCYDLMHLEAEKYLKMMCCSIEQALLNFKL